MGSQYIEKGILMKYFSRFPFLIQDPHARSLSFFCREKISWLDRNVMEEMQEISRQENRDLRISMHVSPAEDLHNMVILQRRETYVRPHKHRSKVETYHMIEGEMLICLFDEKGSLLQRKKLSPQECFLFRFDRGMYHCSVVLSELAIFHENKIGPFIREGDSIFAPWAPGSDPEAIADFVAELQAP